MNYEKLCHMNIGDMNKEQLYEFVQGLLEEVWNFEKEIDRLNNIIDKANKCIKTYKETVGNSLVGITANLIHNLEYILQGEDKQ